MKFSWVDNLCLYDSLFSLTPVPFAVLSLPSRQGVTLREVVTGVVKMVTTHTP